MSVTSITSSILIDFEIETDPSIPHPTLEAFMRQLNNDELVQQWPELFLTPLKRMGVRTLDDMQSAYRFQCKTCKIRVKISKNMSVTQKIYPAQRHTQSQSREFIVLLIVVVVVVIVVTVVNKSSRAKVEGVQKAQKISLALRTSDDLAKMGNRLNLETLLTQAVKIVDLVHLPDSSQTTSRSMESCASPVPIIDDATNPGVSCETSLVNSEPQCLTPSTSSLLVSATASLLDAQASPPNASDALGTSPATTRAPTPVCASEHDTSPLVPTSALRRNPYGSDVAAAEVREDDQDEDEEMLDEFADVCEDEDLEHDPVDCGLAPDPDLAATAKQKINIPIDSWIVPSTTVLRVAPAPAR
ncbi:hypothetical protein DFH29DRAFT_870841 [Suillus ampliporus]|nr:hypothetical protein DFH29DRAFT_870841 [Suillus ampliporus]